jgi:DNA-binding XRE family transcriptional regulator
MKISGRQVKLAIKGKYTQEEAAEKLNVSRQTFNSWLSKAELSPEVVENIKTQLNIELAGYNLESNFDATSAPKESSLVVKTDGKLSRDIPVFNDKAAGGAVEIYSDEVEYEPAFTVRIPQFADCDFGKMIYGHSMYPTYKNGTYLFMKRIGNLRQVAPGEVYYIETQYLKVVKRLQFGDGDDHFLAFSDNEEKRPDGGIKFQVFPIYKEDIINLYIVKGSVEQSQN